MNPAGAGGVAGPDPGRGPVGVVLAAGRGERFGGPKQLASLGGEPLVAHAVRTVAAAGLPVVVVTGPSAEGPDDELDRAGGGLGEGLGEGGPDTASTEDHPVVATTGHGGDAARVAAAVRAVVSSAVVVANPDPARGMGSSLAAAARALGPVDLVVVLADQPGVPTVDLLRVVAALADGAVAARTTFTDGGAGHPVGFAAGLHEHLCTLHDEGDGRRLLQRVGATDVAVDHPRPPDVDTPDDLAALASTWAAAGPAGTAPGSGTGSGTGGPHGEAVGRGDAAGDRGVAGGTARGVDGGDGRPSPGPGPSAGA